MMKLGKKRLLGLLTAATIVVTTVGSFAVWDTLSGTTTGNLALDKPVTVTASGGTAYSAGERTLGTANTYTASDVQFDVANVADVTGAALTLTPKVTIGSETADVADQFDIAITKDGQPVVANKDTTPAVTNTYSVALTPKDSASSAVTDAAAAGISLKVEITGVLSGTSTTP